MGVLQLSAKPKVETVHPGFTEWYGYAYSCDTILLSETYVY